MLFILIKSLERKLKNLKDLAKVSQPSVYAILVGLEKRFPMIPDERVLHAKDYVIATESHPFFKLKWFPDSQKDVAVELLVDEAKKVEDFRSTRLIKVVFCLEVNTLILVMKKLLIVILATVAVKPIL